jgi:hypothetical protein
LTATANIGSCNALDAVNDPFSSSSPIVDTVIGNVTTNDRLNGVLVTTTNTDVTPLTTGPLSIDVMEY